MRTPAGATKLLTFLVLLVLLGVGGCAAPAPVGSGAVGSSTVSSSTIGSSTIGSSTVGSSTVGSSTIGSSTVALSTSTQITATPSTSTHVPAPPVAAGSGSIVTPLPACKSVALHTLVPGKLTFTTGEKATAPWFVGNDPASGRGYESAVAAAVARKLGYSPRDVRWTRSDLSRVAAGRATGFDVAVGEFAALDQTGAPVDYSTGYFADADSVVARTGTAAARVSSLDGLRFLRIAVTSGSPGRNSAGVLVDASVRIGYSTAGGLAALRAGSVDAAILPTSTALSAGAWVTVIGQLPRSREQSPQFGMVLAKKSPLTGCVSAAIDELRVTGALDSMVRTWVPAAARPLG